MSSTNMLIALWVAGMIALGIAYAVFGGGIWSGFGVTVTAMVWTWYCGERPIRYGCADYNDEYDNWYKETEHEDEA